MLTFWNANLTACLLPFIPFPLYCVFWFFQQPGLACPNAACGAYYWGAVNEAACVSTLYQRLTLAVRNHMRVYYQTHLRCDDR